MKPWLNPRMMTRIRQSRRHGYLTGSSNYGCGDGHGSFYHFLLGFLSLGIFHGGERHHPELQGHRNGHDGHGGGPHQRHQNDHGGRGGGKNIRRHHSFCIHGSRRPSSDSMVAIIMHRYIYIYITIMLSHLYNGVCNYHSNLHILVSLILNWWYKLCIIACKQCVIHLTKFWRWHFKHTIIMQNIKFMSFNFEVYQMLDILCKFWNDDLTV